MRSPLINGLGSKRTVRMKDSDYISIRCDNSNDITFYHADKRSGHARISFMQKDSPIYMGHCSMGFILTGTNEYALSVNEKSEGLAEFLGINWDERGFCQSRNWHELRGLDITHSMVSTANHVDHTEENLGSKNVIFVKSGKVSALTLSENHPRRNKKDEENDWIEVPSLDYTAAVTPTAGLMVASQKYGGNEYFRICKAGNDNVGMVCVKVHNDPKYVKDPQSMFEIGSSHNMLGTAIGRFDVSTGDVLDLYIETSNQWDGTPHGEHIPVITGGEPAGGYLMSHSLFYDDPKNIVGLCPTAEDVLNRLNERSVDEVREYLASTRSNAIDFFRSGESIFKRMA